MTRTSEIRAVAATVYDQDTHAPSDMAFLAAIAATDRECSETLARSNIQWGPLSEAHQIVKRLTEKRREDGYRQALAQLEAAEDADIMGDVLQAAE
jgi:thioredoxin-like negative regulator of GroEL